MSLYTTGEIAQQAGITVRTVQYYDRKHLVSPTNYLKVDVAYTLIKI
ncbi:hypothetical protein S100892_00331 [Pediococcus pentosaceus]|uniref:HTH merR-type domain-containing protein n=1 Tax=Pediococcus pentosaceus TaxID=1255 RepID=A0A1Y0VS21_PEDPE|nr:hypothetical protein S100892_00331 [Pediococcus pentosaceus]